MIPCRKLQNKGRYVRFPSIPKFNHSLNYIKEFALANLKKSIDYPCENARESIPQFNQMKSFVIGSSSTKLLCMD